MSARAAPASMTTRRKAAHRIADRVLFNFLLSLYGRSRLNRNTNRRPRCGDRSGGVFRKCSPPRLSPEADGSGGFQPERVGLGSFQEALSAASGSKAEDSSPKGPGWGVFRKRYLPRPARKRGIPARKGRAGEFSGSVIGRVRLESGEIPAREGRAGEFSGSVIGRVRLESGGIPARKGRAGGVCESVICRVRLRRLGRRHHRRGLHRSRRRNGCRRRSCRRNDRRSRRRNGR